MSSTLLRRGFTGNTLPANGPLIKFQKIDRPTLPVVSVAPITATVRGSKMASSDDRGSERGTGSSSVRTRTRIGHYQFPGKGESRSITRGHLWQRP